MEGLNTYVADCKVAPAGKSLSLGGTPYLLMNLPYYLSTKIPE